MFDKWAVTKTYNNIYGYWPFKLHSPILWDMPEVNYLVIVNATS